MNLEVTLNLLEVLTRLSLPTLAVIERESSGVDPSSNPKAHGGLRNKVEELLKHKILSELRTTSLLPRRCLRMLKGRGPGEEKGRRGKNRRPVVVGDRRRQGRGDDGPCMLAVGITESSILGSRVDVEKVRKRSHEIF